MAFYFLGCISLNMSINVPDRGTIFIGMALTVVWIEQRSGTTQTQEPIIVIKVWKYKKGDIMKVTIINGS